MAKFIYNIISIVIFFSVFALCSCNETFKVPSISEENANYIQQLDSIISNKDTTLIVFYTDWCVGKNNIDRNYSQYLAKIKAENKNAQIVLIASDDNITDSTINARNQEGYIAMRIQAGTNALDNRLSIRNFIKHAFPNHTITDLEQVGIMIPVVLWVTKDKKILNDPDVKKSSEIFGDVMGWNTPSK